MPNPPATLGARLKALMEANGLKNPAVAAAAGVDPVTVSQWRSDRQKPSDEALERIARLLGTTESFLRYGAMDGHAPEVRVNRVSEPAPRLARNLPLRIREYLAEFQLRLTKGGASEDEIDEAMALLKAPELFVFYKGGAPSEYNEEDVLRGMKGIGEGVIIPELRDRGRKIR